MIKQRTIKNVIRAAGIGVHSGERVEITLRPAAPDTGIIFRRIDQNPVVEIPARSEFVAHTNLSTSLCFNGVSIGTVEHLLSALAGMGIDNLYIDLNAEELPIMDGSSAPFVFLIQSAGIEIQDAPKSFIRIKQIVCIEEGDKKVQLEPYDGFKVTFQMDYNHPVLNAHNQTAIFDSATTSYIKEISRARTFGFLADYEYIRKNNLARGASLANALVLDDSKIMNEEGFRYPNECAKHKILDVIGDLYLLGYQMIGSFTGHKSGHALNYQLLQALLKKQDSWEIVSFKKNVYPFIENQGIENQGEVAS